MTIKGILTLFHLLLLVSAAFHAKPPANAEELQATAAFARLKSLTGDWRSVGPNGEHSRLNYQVISSGTAIMERFTSDALPHSSGSMITVYYIDKGQLVLTHYCIAGNQPHLRATLYDPQRDELDFDFVEGGKTSSPATKDTCIAHASASSTTITSAASGNLCRRAPQSSRNCRSSRA